jgi:hypothetical protein
LLEQTGHPIELSVEIFKHLALAIHRRLEFGHLIALRQQLRGQLG